MMTNKQEIDSRGLSAFSLCQRVVGCCPLKYVERNEIIQLIANGFFFYVVIVFILSIRA